ncbi:hypothetical protein CPT_Shady_007 [Streptomyces phage Shady]|uniref:Head-to-tail stopper n=1 Tax=Streptomyces phage Shady TaxID=2767585 RepID=A0A873WHY4_9CAUD|nr:hypothetical protein CPT_Shady_007 [Streptomyces phage Shady]
MAIFDRAPVLAKVFPVVLVDDGYGGTRPGEGTPVEIRVFAQPMGSEDPNGWSSPERYKIIARQLPFLSAWSRVEMMGRVWSVVRQPRIHAASRRTTFATAEVVEKTTQSQAGGNGA